MQQIDTFPSAEAASFLRSLGVTYVVTHAGVDTAAIARARQSDDFSLLLRVADDYLFKVNRK
jgi:hypothetical protein